jgi:hypothetical protein
VTAPPAGAEGPQLVHGARQPFDTGNTLLSIVPSEMTVSVQDTPIGQRLAVTIRTADTTLTVFLAKDEVSSWEGALASGRAKMTGLIIPG